MISLKDIARSLVSPGKGILAAGTELLLWPRASVPGAPGLGWKKENTAAAQKALLHRALCNHDARFGRYDETQESTAPPATENIPHMKSPDFIKWFADTRIEDMPLVGGKNASLV